MCKGCKRYWFMVLEYSTDNDGSNFFNQVGIKGCAVGIEKQINPTIITISGTSVVVMLVRIRP